MLNSISIRCTKKEDKQQFLDNLETWNCILGKGMDKQMFDLMKYSSTHCKMDCKVLMDGYCVFRDWKFEHTELDLDSISQFNH